MIKADSSGMRKHGGMTMKKSVLDTIIQEQYPHILKYCCKCLHGDIHAAQDCTQEVFLLLYRKIHSLDMTKDIRPWLYRSADRVVKAYLRKNPAPVETDAEPETADLTDIPESVFDVLSQEERELVDAYYSKADKQQIAKEKGITLQSLYVTMARIKKKLRKALGEANKI